MVVRPSAVAGQFYPGNADRLRKQVSDLLAGVAMPIKNTPEALIAPHAGYIYSGPVAANAFAAIAATGALFRRVLLVGPAHYIPVGGVAAPSSAAFATPLGRVQLDRDAIASLVEAGLVSIDDRAHVP